jgi:lysophospholipase L1-like esterase
MSKLKNVLLALTPLAVLVVGGELALWAVGAGDRGEQLSLSRGFDRTASYLVADPETLGGWRTQMFEKEHLEVRVPPKGKAPRVLLLGGSNTQGFPTKDLKTKLVTASGEDWEVVNLGRSGYGSERVSILLEQSLVLEPDVILIYSGHNEFMERSFAQSLTEQGALSGFGKVVEELKALRLMNVLLNAFEPDLRDRSGDRRPEAKSNRSKSFKDLDYDATLRYHEEYARNLGSMIDLTSDADVPVVLCTVIGNDFVPPYTANHRDELSADDEQAFLRAVGQGHRRIPERFIKGLLPPTHLRQPDWGMTLRPEELAGRLAEPPAGSRDVPSLRTLTGALAHGAETHGPKGSSVAGAHWPDPQLWTSVVYDVLETISRLDQPVLTDDERAELVHAAVFFEQALGYSPDHPTTLFALGVVRYIEGDAGEARRLWNAAHNADRAPRRGTDHSNNAVRKLAADRPDDIVLVDCESLFRERSPDGLIGFEIMTDVCHLQPGARLVQLDDFVPAIREASRRR